MNHAGKKSAKNRPQIFPNYSFKICVECYQYLLHCRRQWVETFTIVFCSSYCFKFFILWISTAHQQKAHFLTSSVVTSQEWNLRIQIGHVLQFCMHCISAKYHSFRFQTFEGETFGGFDFLIGHQRVTWLVTTETVNPKYFWNQVLLLVSISKTCL